jgi:YHS domain-containing protein
MKLIHTDRCRTAAPLFSRVLPVFMLAIFLYSCNEQPAKPAPYQSPAYAKKDSSKPKFTRDMVDNIKDPSCGMPLTAGIGDTLHYQGKVYGFCSDECRDEFKKNPAALAKTAEMKKK